MSHSKEREEKICLNCNAELNGRFCHVCGQENLEPKESVWSLISHFFYDITHFDGKFFSTLKYLIRRPGFLSKEFIRGRRASYLNPIKMYVFSSAIFFTIFFSLFNVKNMNLGEDNEPDRKDSTLIIADKKQEAVVNAATSEDSISGENRDSSRQIYRYTRRSNDSLLSMRPAMAGVDSAGKSEAPSQWQREKQAALKDAKTFQDSIKVEAYYGGMETVEKSNGEVGEKEVETYIAENANTKFNIKGVLYETRAQYDSAQKALPARQRDGWFKKLAKYRTIELTHKYKGRPKQFFRDAADKFVHLLPYMLFISLPLYALFLKLLYIRRKNFYYVDHGIFLVHLYIFTFLFLLVLFSLMELNKVLDSGWITFLQIVLILYGIYYTMKAMRNFYGQRWGKTIVKFILLNFLAMNTLALLFTLFSILTVLRI